ncbi:MAG: NifB/NifX family molybdenum-iron cluster-binding protein [Erysipelotrichaceae bacterium]|nr:NifB/NifX family molybdenum-iron cluster-binding protein [Erysipelotrichaceae bacterium]MBQ7888885.1 NifB/NifX family molybdenum-iron cluster-binding protein [Erysipelotrichaceae bacterium]
MKIAIPTQNNQVWQHFGRSPEFTMYTIENQKIIKKEIVLANGAGHTDLVMLLKRHFVNVLICGGLGSCAIECAHANHIEVYSGTSGNADDILHHYLNGTLNALNTPTCDHHDHDDHHECHCH